MILTYALCGFANFGSMGVALAAIGTFAQERKRILVKIAPRALIASNMVSLMTASIAGNYDTLFLCIFSSYKFKSFVGLLYDPIPILNTNSTVDYL